MNRTLAVALALIVGFASLPALGQDGRLTLVSRAPFRQVAEALEKAIAEQKMVLVCHADAQRGAAARGVSIKGNQVFMVFRNDFAVRVLAAEPAAGFEAPIRIYLYERPQRNRDRDLSPTLGRVRVVRASRGTCSGARAGPDLQDDRRPRPRGALTRGASARTLLLDLGSRPA